MTIAMQPIYTQTIGTSAPVSVTFNNIPQTFTDLKLFVSAKDTSVPGSIYYAVNYALRINGDNTSLYSNTIAYSNSSNNSAASARNLIATTLSYVGVNNAGSSQVANIFSNNEIYIPNYTVSNFKSFSFDSVVENNVVGGETYNVLGSGLYRNTSSITNLTLSTSGSGFAQHSTFTLYGITKG